MIIIIDSYNILKSTLKSSFISENQRKDFISKVKIYANKTKNKVTLVFDGGDCTWPLISTDKQIKIVYSGMHYSADDWIKQYIKEHKGYDIILISSDRELYAFAHSYHKASINSIDFYKLLQKTISNFDNLKQGINPNNIRKFKSNEENPELDQLMVNSNISYKDKKNMDFNDSKGLNSSNPKNNKLSKHERKLLALIKKL